MSQVFLSFHICGELFGINVSKVLEVLQSREITEVPKSPSYIVGIINFRGDVVPVVDARLRFNLNTRGEEENFVIAVLDLVKNNEPFRAGVMVDSVRDVITIEDSDIRPVPPMDSKFNTEYLKGVVRYNEQFILLLDIEKVFSENVQMKDIEIQSI